MKRLQSTRSSLFLMELIIAIFILTVVSAICLEIFAYSHTMNKESHNQLQASLKAQDIAEMWLSQEKSSVNDQYYDASWNEVSLEKAVYSLKTQHTNESLDITVYEDQDIIYTLHVDKHVPLRGEDYE